MGLSDDQKAMLRLLAQRGEQGYEDIAALKGLSVGEVGAQVREAISTLEGEGIPAPAIPPPPGGAVGEDAPTPPPAEKKVEAEREEPEPPAPAPAHEDEDEPAPAERPKAKPAPAIRRRSRPAPKPGLPAGKGARAAIAAAIGVVVVVVVILLVSGGGGGSSSPATETGAEAAKGGTVAVALKRAEGEASNGKQAPTYAALRPAAGGEGLGIAIFGKVKKALALRVVVEGLEQTRDGDSYTVWLSDGPTKMLPLASTEVTEKGTINAQVEVPLEVLAYLASETFDEIAITRTSEAKLKASLKTASKAKKAPAYIGTEVLRGPVTGPIVGAKQRIQEEEAAKKE